MLKRFIVYSVSIVVLAMLAIPATAGVTVTQPALTHSWPDFSADVRDSSANGSRLYVNTMAGTIFNGDPNALSGDASPPYQLVGENFNDRALSGPFGIPIDNNIPYTTPYGLTLTHITIAANGGGAEAGQPMSLHIYDLNTLPPNPYTGTQANYNLVGGAGGATVANDCMLPPGDFLSSSATFIYEFNDAPDRPHMFIDFNFTGYDSFDLEPGHEYAFEIWPTKGDNPGWFWHRDTATQNYPYGKCYRVDPPTDYRLLTSQRQAVAAGTRCQVMAVYGIPCEANAFHPVPRNLETTVPLTADLKWHAGKYSGPGSHSGHMLYFSTNEAAVRNRGTAARIGKLTDANFADVNNPSWTPTGMLPDKIYYWRVDEYNDLNTPTPPNGNYWGRSNYGYWVFQSTGPKATAPSPKNNSATAEFKPESAWLSWTRGCYVGPTDTSAHLVYFGTNFNDVNTATTSISLIYRGAVTDPCYPLANLYPDYTLNSGTTYYWRIDEVNVTTGTTKGDTWNFTMPNPAYILLDNFGYQSDSEMDVVWKSGYRLPYTPPGGSGSDADQNNVSGSTSVSGSVMTLNYDNSYTINGPWSEAMFDYSFVSSTGIDWTLGGAFVPKAISIQFNGAIANTLNTTNVDYDKIYLGIEDLQGNKGVAYLSDSYAAQRNTAITASSAATREFKVALDDLTNPNNVDVTQISKVFVGIGGLRGAFQGLYSGGSGALQFGNLRVYVQHCNPPMSNDNTIPGDLAGPQAGVWTGQHNRFTKQDCVVNYNDIWFFAADWLLNEPNLSYPSATDPGTGNLTVWYKFDDGPGATGGTDPCGLSYITLVDSSGNGRDAALYISNPFTWAYAGHDGTNYSLNFEPGYRSWVQCPNSVVGGTNGQSFTFWSRFDDRFFMDHVWASVLVFHRNPPGGADAQTMETQLPVPWTPGDVSRPWLRWVNQAVNNREIPNNQMQRESTFSSRWNHYALVYDTDATEGKMVMYRNGEQIGAFVDGNFVDANLWQPETTAQSVRLATRSNSSTDASYGAWQGRIDDMRLYSKALNKNEVEWLATDGTKARDMQAVFTEPTNFNSNSTVVLPTGPTVKIINFNDYAILAGYWLDEQQSF